MGSRKIPRVFVMHLAECKYCMFSLMFFRAPVGCLTGPEDRLRVVASRVVTIVTVQSTYQDTIKSMFLRGWTLGWRLRRLSLCQPSYSPIVSGKPALVGRPGLPRFCVHPVTQGFEMENHRWTGNSCGVWEAKVRGAGADFPSRDGWIHDF